MFGMNELKKYIAFIYKRKKRKMVNYSKDRSNH